MIKQVEERFFSCACFGEGLRVSFWPGDGEFYLSMWSYRHAGKPSWRQRFRHIWNIIRVGDPWEDECLLTHIEAKELQIFLMESLNKLK